MSVNENLTNEETPYGEVNKYAIVVGVNNSAISSYHDTLQYAEKDAYDMALVLEHVCNFTLLAPPLIGENANTMGIRRAVTKLAQKKTDRDFLLFYFAGHAQPMKTRGGRSDIYFVTFDFSEDEVETDLAMHLSMRWLREILYQMEGAGRVLIVLDCCYGGNMIDAVSDRHQIDIRQLVEECFDDSNTKQQKDRLRLILTATGYNIKAMEKDGHGLMTGLLLRALRGDEDEALDNEGKVDLLSLHKYLQRNMPNEHFPNLLGDFTRPCELASHPHRSASFRQQAREIELRGEVEKGILAELFKLHAETQHTQPFDHSICYHATFNELDQEKIAEFLKQERVRQEDAFRPSISEQEQLQQFGFLKDLYPTYGTLLCFGRNPSKWVSGATTRCVDWGSNTSFDRMEDSREYNGGLLRQFELSRDFLRKCLRLRRIIDRQGSTEEWEIPFRVLDEALANALVHREYANRTDPVRIEVFDNRIEISSPGTLPPPMTEALLQEKHKSYPRNPQIAGIFYLHGYIEKFGTGIQRIQRFIKEAGLQAPEFRTNEDKTFTVIVYRPKEAQQFAQDDKYVDVVSTPVKSTSTLQKEPSQQEQEDDAISTPIKSAEKQIPERKSKTSSLLSAISRKEITCPFCFSTFKVPDIRFRCVNPVCPGRTPDPLYAQPRGLPPITMGRVLSPKPQLFGTSRHTVCDICKVESYTRLCPSCHFELSDDIDNTKQNIIAIIGGSNAGKSHYIAALIRTLLYEIATDFDFSLQMLGDDTRMRWQQDFYNPLFVQKRVLQPTQPGIINSAVKTPLIFRLSQRNMKRITSVNLSFFDTAGEDMTSLNAMSTQARYISHADAIIVLLDPLQVPSIRQFLPSVNSSPADLQHSPENVVSRLRELLERMYDLSPTQRIKIPVAFTLSKVDVLQSIVGKDSILLRPSEHKGFLDLNVVQSMNTEIANYLNQWISPSFSQLIENSFASYCYFGVSSLGTQPDAKGHLSVVSPIHVEDPFLWILYKLNLIKGKRT